MPTSKVADDDENKTANDKRDNGEVQCKHDICKVLIGQVVAHL